MKIEKTINKDGSVCYLATGNCDDYNFIAEGNTRSEAFQSALILIRERGVSRCFTPYLKVIECP